MCWQRNGNGGAVNTMRRQGSLLNIVIKAYIFVISYIASLVKNERIQDVF